MTVVCGVISVDSKVVGILGNQNKLRQSGKQENARHLGESTSGLVQEVPSLSG